MNYRKLTLGTAANIVKLHDGTGQLESMVDKMSDTEKITIKYPQYNLGQIERVINTITPEIFDKLIEGGFKTSYSSNCINFHLELLKLVDNNGRVIPYNLKSQTCTADTDFSFNPAIFLTVSDCKSRIKRLEAAGFHVPFSADDLWKKSMKLAEEVKSLGKVGNLLNGTWVPVVLPAINHVDIGDATDELISKLATTYEKEYIKENKDMPAFIIEYKFSGKLEIINSRYRRLVKRLRNGPIIGLYFLDPFGGFSPDAEMEIIEKFRKEYVPSGSIEGIVSRIMYPDLLFKQQQTLNSNFSSIADKNNGTLSFYQHPNSRFSCDTNRKSSISRESFSGGILYTGKQNR